MEGSALVEMEHNAGAGHEMRRDRQESSPGGNYAFLNHSSTTLPNNLPPSIDDKQLARQKRKRTSPEDQAILEAAYIRDSKPDKAARLELVKRVALGEKEVQIWFQNRRQTTRRKSRPLLPHEIAQYHMSRGVCSYELQSFALGSSSTSGGGPLSISSSSGCLDAASSSPDLASSHSTEASSAVDPQSVLASGSAAPSMSDRAPMGYLANRRSAPNLRPDFEGDRLLVPRPVQGLQRRTSSSLVRLSLTGDGNAQVVTKKGSSPSPPRLPQLINVCPDKCAAPQMALRESLSTHARPEPRSLHRSSSVRSRDSRTWEFWCDKEARNELENTAQKDASGSAADAIDLLRSTSGRKVLGALSTRRNNVQSRHTSFLQQRRKVDGKPPTLQKSSTSLGRLQSSSKLSSDPVALRKVVGDVHIPGNDSDKENWSPQSNEQSEKRADDRSASHDWYLRGDENYKPHPLKADVEAAALMRGGSKSNSAEDLDCIQGLLSLSQGNWR